jgi:SAM-dependent methyltransferase
MDYDIIESTVNRTISPHDGMFTGESYYFKVGRSALECVDISLRAARMNVCDVRRILDLPCGHGRVLRYLRTAFPEAEITACDIERKCVDYCASTFGAVPVRSEDDPHKIPIERGSFDLIWVGSLLTHLDSGLWSDFLDVFRSSLRPGGLLIFTTHGLQTYRANLEAYRRDFRSYATLLYDYEREGFGYEKYPDSDGYYGISLSSPAWVLTQLAKVGGLRTVHFGEMSWEYHHDCYACLRDDSYQVAPSGIATHRYMLKYLYRKLPLPFRRRLRKLFRG